MQHLLVFSSLSPCTWLQIGADILTSARCMFLWPSIQSSDIGAVLPQYSCACMARANRSCHSYKAIGGRSTMLLNFHWGLYRCRSRCSVRSVLRCVRTWWPSGGCLQRSSRPSQSTFSWRSVRRTLRHISVRVSCLHNFLLGCRGMPKPRQVSFLPPQ